MQSPLHSSGSVLGTNSFPSGVGICILWREFVPTPASIGEARHALDGIRDEVGDDLHAIAVLLVSELVTNSLQHSNADTGGIELIVCLTEGELRVTVSDGGEGFSAPPVPDLESVSGKGLHLVQELSDRWGHRAGIRACVWFEIDRPRRVERDPVTLSPPVDLYLPTAS